MPEEEDLSFWFRWCSGAGGHSADVLRDRTIYPLPRWSDKMGKKEKSEGWQIKCRGKACLPHGPSERAGDVWRLYRSAGSAVVAVDSSGGERRREEPLGTK